MSEQRYERTICTLGTQNQWVESSDSARTSWAHANAARNLGLRNGRYTRLGQDGVANRCSKIYNLCVVRTGMELPIRYEYILVVI